MSQAKTLTLTESEAEILCRLVDAEIEANDDFADRVSRFGRTTVDIEYQHRTVARALRQLKRKLVRS